MSIINLSEDEKILKARVVEGVKKALDGGTAVYTDFLSDRECEIVLETVTEMGATENMLLFGGYDDAERCIAGFFPEYCLYMEKEELLSEFPLSVLKIECSGFREHTHRDFLGSILALGVERCVIGDICVGEKGYFAYVFVHKKIEHFIIETLKLVGRDGVRISVCNGEDQLGIKREYLIIKGTCASMRVDAVASEILNISREKSKTMIEAGLITVNHSEDFSGSEKIDVGDIISARGYGKYRISQIGETNRKGRIRFEVQKYV